MSGVETVLVAGRDAPLWLAAATIRQALAPAGVTVRAVELPSGLTPADGHATQPALEALHNRIGIEETVLLRLTGGAYSLGRNIVEATGEISPFMIPFGSFGTRIEGQDFFACWLKARGLGLDVALEHFSLTAAAARQGRILFPDDATDSYGRCDYGYHLPAIPYARSLKALAGHLGVEIHETSAIEAVRGADGIEALLVDGGRRIEADLFVDVGAGLTTGHLRESWRGAFPVDRVLAATGPRFGSIPAYAEIRASEGGWTALHPAASHTQVVHAWSSLHRSDEEAVREAGEVGGLTLGDIAIRAIEPGWLAEPWSQNCVAIGEAADAIDPIHDLGLHLVQLGLVHLLACFPAWASFAAQRAEYNRTMRSAIDRVRDFQSAFYVGNRFAGSFWDVARGVDHSPELEHLVATFAARGEIAPFEDEGFTADIWRALLTGQGIVPDSHVPTIDRIDPQAIKDGFRTMLGFVREQVMSRPTHDDLLRRIAHAP
ncbi:tryptophan halogenase [Nostoc sp. 3335mG]|nr:tryptophan halogenase [Nostoc sp. 3335mG]